MLNIFKVERSGFSPAIKDCAKEINQFHIHIEYPETGKCERVPLEQMLHVFTEKEILSGFKGELPKKVWYRLTTKNGCDVNNWKVALRILLKLEY